jgi:hypothetical protein
MSYFWGFVTFACLIWYTLMCVYITIYGAFDIKSMLSHLHHGEDKKDSEG